MNKTSTAAPTRLLAALLLALAGCARDEGEARTEGPPALVPLDSVYLAEADTLYIGSPYTPVIDP